MSAPRLTAELLEQLQEVRAGFDPDRRRRKRALLRRCSAAEPPGPRLLRAYHDLLLFLVAYPDGAAVHRLATRELARLAAAGERRERCPATLVNSGIAGTVVESACTLALLQWLLRRFPGDVEPLWEDESAGDGLDRMLRLWTSPAEWDGLHRTELSTQRWMALARGSAQPSDLEWIVRSMARLPATAELRDHLFDGLELTVRWRLRDPAASITALRLTDRPPFLHRGGLRRGVDLTRLLRRPLPPLRPLPRAAAGRVIDAARASLFARCRETDPITHANPGEVTVVPLERGFDVALFGLQPERRLPVESFFGYLAAKNGVPVAYGGAWIFMERAEIGINVFEQFRGGESAYLFGQLLRVYHQHYGAQRFQVDPFQFGDENAEGLRSGAFWFYYRLGFRPVDGAVAELAGQEWAQLRSDRSRRTPLRCLRRLASCPLRMTLPGAAADAIVPDLLDVGVGVTDQIGRRFGGDRAAALGWARRQVGRALHADARRWPPPQREAFDRLALLVALGGDDPFGWPAAQRRGLLALIRAKGSARERPYAVRLRRHAGFRRALERLAEAGRAAADTDPPAPDADGRSGPR